MQLIRVATNKVIELGVERSASGGTIIAENESVIVVKWPGWSYWAAHDERAYQPVSREVYQIDAVEDRIIKVTPLIGWEGKEPAAK